MCPADIKTIQEAIRGEGLDGWLFCNFRHRDRLADAILGIPPGAVNSRTWFYAIPASGEPLSILHDIEPDALGTGAGALPGGKVRYRGREELLARLKPLAGRRWGCHFSPAITAISFLDAGTAALLEEAGLRLASAAGLIQRRTGLLSEAGMESHEQAAAHLYGIVQLAWAETRRAFAGNIPLREGDIQRLILDEFTRRGLVTNHPPIVAAGANSGNPHYNVANNGALFTEGDVIQFDLWAKDAGPGGIFADISWVGVYGKTAPPGAEQAFAGLVAAREGAYRFITEELAAGRRPGGGEVDQKTREILSGCGLAGVIRHRTGHAIDTEVHGSGVNIDSVEFPDSRLLLDGSCFSLEPGAYFTDFGMRTEINVYIKDGRPVISGADRQFALMRC
jgi:Xaa-Pro aminopeptidase